MENIIKLCDFSSSNNLESPDEGSLVHDKIYQIIEQYIENNENFIITFDNIDNITTAFLNNCIGKLFFEFNRTKVENLMSFGGFRNKAQITTLKNSIEML